MDKLLNKHALVKATKVENIEALVARDLLDSPIIDRLHFDGKLTDFTDVTMRHPR